MLTQTDIQQILDERIIPVLKKSTQKNYNPYVAYQESMPEYYPGYLTFNDWRDSIRVHAETGVFPTKLLANRAPNQNEREWEYVKSNYKQITLPMAVDYLATIGRAWSDNNWAIEYNEPASQFTEQSFQKYVEEDIEETPLKMSVEQYFKSVFPYVKMLDAMGCIVVKPHKIPSVDTEDGPVMSGTELLEPIPVYYSVKQLVAVEEQDWYFFELKEKSIVEYAGKRVREGMVYEVYDDMAIWRVTQVGKKIDYTFEIEVYYSHESGAIPVSRCKGAPVPMDGNIVWASRFLSAVPLLDEVILDAVYLRAVKNICAFPYRVMVGNMCEHQEEINGQFERCEGLGYFVDRDSGAQITCRACHGTGLRDRMSPFGVMLLKPQTRDTPDGEMKVSPNPLQYVSPSPEMPELLRREIERNYEAAADILHLTTTNSEVKGSQDVTATARALDMKALYAFVKGDSDQTFDTYNWALKWIGWFRYRDSFEGFTLTYPQSFDFYTDYDYLNQVSEAIKNGLPPFLVQATIMKYMKALWSNDINATKAYDLIMDSDRLITMTDDELILKQSKGLISAWEVILHDSGITFINELYEENPNFFEQERAAQKEQLIQKAKEKASETNTNTGIVETVIGLSNDATGNN